MANGRRRWPGGGEEQRSDGPKRPWPQRLDVFPVDGIEMDSIS